MGIQHVTYEGYGPGGAAVLVACATADSRRTAEEVRSAFARHGGHLGAAGSVAYLFNEVGLLRFPAGVGGDAVSAAAFDAGAEDVIGNEDGSVDVLTDPREFADVNAALEREGLRPERAEVTLRSAVTACLEGEEAGAMLELVTALEGLPGVQNVYTNFSLRP